MHSKYYYVITFILLLSVHATFAATATPIPVPDVIVTAPQQSTTVLTELANTTIINRTQINNSGASSLVQLLNGQPGLRVYTSSNDLQRATISMRGFGSNATQNTLILVDGRRLTNPDMAGADLSTIPLASIQRIEIFPASAGVLYGDQAVGGVINIITQQADKLAGKTSLQYGSYQTIDAYASAANMFSNGINIQVDSDKHVSNNYRKHNQLDTGGSSLRLGYRYDRGSAFIQGQYRQHDVNLPGSVTKKQLNTDRRGVDPDRKHDFADDTSTILTGGFEHWLTPHWSLQTDLSQWWTHGDSTYTTFELTQSRNSMQINPLLIAHYRLFKRPLTWRFGANFEHDCYSLNTTPHNQYNINDKQAKQSVYTQLQLPIGQHLQTIIGTRGAWLQGKLNGKQFDNNAWVSELGLQYQFIPQLTGYVRRSGNYRFPKVDEQNNIHPNQINALKTQTGVSYEIGVRWQSTQYQLSAAVYQLNLRNEIAYMPPDHNRHGIATNRNLDPTRRRGLLLDSRLNVIPRLTLNGNYTYTDGHYSSGPFSGKQIPFVAKNMARISANYHLFTHWQLLAETIFTGKMFAAGDDENKHLIGGYTIYNAAIHYQYKGFGVTSRINNITNKKYYNYVVFQPWASSLGYYPAPRRNFLLTIHYRFL